MSKIHTSYFKFWMGIRMHLPPHNCFLRFFFSGLRRQFHQRGFTREAVKKIVGNCRFRLNGRVLVCCRSRSRADLDTRVLKMANPSAEGPASPKAVHDMHKHPLQCELSKHSLCVHLGPKNQKKKQINSSMSVWVNPPQGHQLCLESLRISNMIS